MADPESAGGGGKVDPTTSIDPTDAELLPCEVDQQDGDNAGSGHLTDGIRLLSAGLLGTF